MSIPSQLGGFQVIALGNLDPWNGVFSYNTSITSVIIPNGVASIGLRTFDHCSSLQSVLIPDTVTTIGRNAFAYCTSLISVTWPAGVSSMEQEMFRDCYALSSVVLPPTLTSIGSEAFSNCSSLSSVNISSPEIVFAAGVFAFSGLRSIDLSNTTANLSESLFYNCTALASVKLPQNMEVVRGWMFYGCSSLTELVIPSGVYSVAQGAFANCGSLTKIYFLGNQPLSGPMTGSFQNSPVTLYVLPTSTGWGSSFAGRPVTSVSATEVLSTPNKFQLFSASQMDSNRIIGRSDVTNNPSTYGLYNSNQYSGNFTAGQQSVLQNPNSHSLYTTNQIHALAIGDLVLTSTNNGQFVLNYDIEQSEDLVNWYPYQGFAMPLTNLPTNKAFVRIKAKQ